MIGIQRNLKGSLKENDARGRKGNKGSTKELQQNTKEIEGIRKGNGGIMTEMKGNAGNT